MSNHDPIALLFRRPVIILTERHTHRHASWLLHKFTNLLPGFEYINVSKILQDRSVVWWQEDNIFVQSDLVLTKITKSLRDIQADFVRLVVNILKNIAIDLDGQSTSDG